MRICDIDHFQTYILLKSHHIFNFRCYIWLKDSKMQVLLVISVKNCKNAEKHLCPNQCCFYSFLRYMLANIVDAYKNGFAFSVCIESVQYVLC